MAAPDKPPSVDAPVADADDADQQLQDLRRILLRPKAIAEPVRESLFVAIQENRDEVAEVIFPVIGPAIRRAIAQALGQMVENTNRLLEKSLSLRALRWRIEAARTGRSLAEVALTHSLQYEVEQVFLIHRESGLLIGHATAQRGLTQPPEVISGMLTGIRDFVQDSFGGTDDDGVRRLEVGDRTVWVEQRSAVVLAAVVRGTGPSELGWQLQEALEDIVVRRGPALARYDGDPEAFRDLQPVLQRCLRSERTTPVRRRPWAIYAAAAAVGLMLVVLGIRQVQWRGRADRAVTLLRQEPGYGLRQTEVGWSSIRIVGGRDPLARPLRDVISATGVDPSRVNAIWISGPDPDLALERASHTLEPPTTVKLRRQPDGALVVTGTAAIQWIDRLPVLARLIDGVRCVDQSALRVAEAVEVDEAARAVEDLRVGFAPGSATPVDAGAVDTLRRALQDLDRFAWNAHTRVRVTVLGSADTTGSDTLNRRLSVSRAQNVVASLDSTPVWSIRFRAQGRAPSAASVTTAAADLRSVRVRVELERPSWYERPSGCR